MSKLGSGTADATKVLYGDGTWKNAPTAAGLALKDVPPYTTIAVEPGGITNRDFPREFSIALSGKVDTDSEDDDIVDHGDLRIGTYATTIRSSSAPPLRGFGSAAVSAHRCTVGRRPALLFPARLQASPCVLDCLTGAVAARLTMRFRFFVNDASFAGGAGTQGPAGPKGDPGPKGDKGDTGPAGAVKVVRVENEDAYNAVNPKEAGTWYWWPAA